MGGEDAVDPSLTRAVPALHNLDARLELLLTERLVEYVGLVCVGSAVGADLVDRVGYVGTYAGGDEDLLGDVALVDAYLAECGHAALYALEDAEGTRRDAVLGLDVFGEWSHGLEHPLYLGDVLRLAANDGVAGVYVDVDEAGEDRLPLRLDYVLRVPVLLVEFVGLAHGDYVLALDGDGAVLDDAESLAAHGEEGSAPDVDVCHWVPVDVRHIIFTIFGEEASVRHCDWGMARSIDRKRGVYLATFTGVILSAFCISSGVISRMKPRWPPLM